jgi:hypothetical protein
MSAAKGHLHQDKRHDHGGWVCATEGTTCDRPAFVDPNFE